MKQTIPPTNLSYPIIRITINNHFISPIPICRFLCLLLNDTRRKHRTYTQYDCYILLDAVSAISDYDRQSSWSNKALSFGRFLSVFSLTEYQSFAIPAGLEPATPIPSLHSLSSIVNLHMPGETRTHISFITVLRIRSPVRYEHKMKCQNCKKETSNPKFCSRKCSATYNNKAFPKRSKTKTCKNCENPILSGYTYCSLCYSSSSFRTKTKGDFVGRRAYQVYSQIRALARKNFSKKRECSVCGYNKNIHICHIQAICDFSNDTPISVINDPSNLIALCPNHHWELDNGILQL